MLSSNYSINADSSACNTDVIRLQNLGQRQKKKDEPVVPLFVLILYEICSAVNLKQIIHWVDNGKAFKIESREMFEEHVLPKFYKHSNFNSFQRQLNMYDFHKKTRSINEIIFFH